MLPMEIHMGYIEEHVSLASEDVGPEEKKKMDYRRCLAACPICNKTLLPHTCPVCYMLHTWNLHRALSELRCIPMQPGPHLENPLRLKCCRASHISQPKGVGVPKEVGFTGAKHCNSTSFKNHNTLLSSPRSNP